MRPIGFSTGALALSNFRLALSMLKGKGTDVVELSALREHELVPLVDALPTLDLGDFNHISVHVPSSMNPGFEKTAVAKLEEVVGRGWFIIVHPDVIENYAEWKRFGNLVCIENMDKRKPTGQTARQLQKVFDQLPEASLCLDLGHARQVDPTMTEAFLILRCFANRLRQLHVSEVSSDSRHGELSLEACIAFKRVADAIPGDVPAVIESRVPRPDIDREIKIVRQILGRDADRAIPSEQFISKPAFAF